MLVYKITNKVNPRVYVGLTVCTLEKRWREHRSAANTGVEKPLYRAMRKHGIENFSIELLYAAKDFDDLRAAELRFIEELKAHTLDGGYNLTDHGARYGAPNSPKGEIQYKSKLTEEMVAFIRDPVHWDKDNTDLLNMVNQKFNNDLSRDTVRDARRGDSWKHLNKKYPPVKLGRGRRIKPVSEELRAQQRDVLAKYRPQAIAKAKLRWAKHV